MGNLKQKGRKELPVQKTLKDKNMEDVRNAKKHQQSESGGKAEERTSTDLHPQSVANETAVLVHEGRNKNCCPAKERSYQSFTVICNKELVQKVKGIAKKEGLHINALVQAMYEGVCQLNCVTLDCQELLGDNPERLFPVFRI